MRLRIVIISFLFLTTTLIANDEENTPLYKFYDLPGDITQALAHEIMIQELAFVDDIGPSDKELGKDRFKNQPDFYELPLQVFMINSNQPVYLEIGGNSINHWPSQIPIRVFRKKDNWAWAFNGRHSYEYGIVSFRDLTPIPADKILFNSHTPMAKDYPRSVYR